MVPGHEVTEATVAVAVGEPRQRARQPGLGIDVVQLAGFDERCDHGPALTALIRAGEQGVLTVERHHPFILPMSGTMWTFDIPGTPVSGAAFAYCGWNSARLAGSITWADLQGRS